MVELIIPDEVLLCPDPWCRKHTYFNLETGSTRPARCKRWSCFPCAKLNYYRASYLAAAGNAERFVTLTRAGKTPKEINFNLKKLLQGLRRAGYKFEYFAVPELHKNGQAHIHLLQRGDYIDFEILQEMWKTYTAASYSGKGSFHVRITKIDNNLHARRYLMKYIKKSWTKHNDKSWQKLQNLYPGLNHYRMSRGWLPETLQAPQSWQLVPNHLIPAMTAEYAFGEEIRPTQADYPEDFTDPFTP